VNLRIFDQRARLVTTLVNEQRQPGYHHAKWDGRDAAGQRVASGVYIYRLDTGERVLTRKLLLAK
jgi:flagellar hook assembly protein FlgD